MHEKAIISLLQLYVGVVKIKRNYGAAGNFTMNKVNAHTVLFKDDSTGVVQHCWDERHMEECIMMDFICPDGKPDMLAKATLQDTRILGRSYVVHQWLSVLGEG